MCMLIFYVSKIGIMHARRLIYNFYTILSLFAWIMCIVSFNNPIQSLVSKNFCILHSKIFIKQLNCMHRMLLMFVYLDYPIHIIISTTTINTSVACACQNNNNTMTGISTWSYYHHMWTFKQENAYPHKQLSIHTMGRGLK